MDNSFIFCSIREMEYRFIVLLVNREKTKHLVKTFFIFLLATNQTLTFQDVRFTTVSVMKQIIEKCCPVSTN